MHHAGTHEGDMTSQDGAACTSPTQLKGTTASKKIYQAHYVGVFMYVTRAILGFNACTGNYKSK
jgi:hypothetical protein